jgi:hypothetical protein
MRKIIGVVLMLAGVAFGLYAGLWWAFIGGIVDVIHAIKAPDMVALDVAIGIVKVMCAGIIGTMCGVVAVFPGFALFSIGK